MIPEAAVEAAEDAVRNAMYAHGPDGHDDGYEEITRAAIEAAAPHMLAAAWDEGGSAATGTYDTGYPSRNPYRPTP